MTSTARKTRALALTLAGILPVIVTGPTEAKSAVPGQALTSESNGGATAAPEVIAPPFACGALPAYHLKALGPPKVGGADCSFFNTTIDDAYDPDEVIRIPVVVHVVHMADGTGLLDEATVRSQIDVLNDDFNGAGGLGADVELTFFLASEDENGTSSSGIEYIENDSLYDCVYPCADMKIELSANWDPNKFLNIFFAGGCAIGFRGWSTFAQNPQVQGTGSDGVVIDWRVFGASAPGYPYDQGHTVTHQIGHYLGLLHTFAPEPSGCPSGLPTCYKDDGDLLCDTLPAFEATFICGMDAIIPCLPVETSQVPASGSTNFMNVPDDSCAEGFTPDQVNRMRCTLENYRSGLVAHGQPFLFSDGFETGDTTRWNETVGKRGVDRKTDPVHRHGTQGERQ